MRVATKSEDATMLKSMTVATDCCVVLGFVGVHDNKTMNDGWCIAKSRRDESTPEVVKGCRERLSILDTFRDAKNRLLAMGLSTTHTGDEAPRDRCIFGAAYGDLLTDYELSRELLGVV